MRSYDIATIEGDGIGPEVCRAAVTVLSEACGSGLLRFANFDGGALHYNGLATHPEQPGASNGRPGCEVSHSADPKACRVPLSCPTGKTR